MESQRQDHLEVSHHGNVLQDFQYPVSCSKAVYLKEKRLAMIFFARALERGLNPVFQYNAVLILRKAYDRSTRKNSYPDRF